MKLRRTFDYKDRQPGDGVPFVRLDWEDIKWVDNWNEEITIFDTSSNTHWGYLIERTKTKVVLAHGYCWEDSKWVSTHTFPAGACEITIIEGVE